MILLSLVRMRALRGFCCPSPALSVLILFLLLTMTVWINNRKPDKVDGDIHGMVLWGKQDGLLMDWRGVRAGEYWAHSSAWQQSARLLDASQGNHA
jgi:hypothetical protein